MNMTVTVDTRAFTAALREYAAARRVDNAYAVNRAARNVAMNAIGLTKAANKDEIANLWQKEWWNKYVSKRLASGVEVKRKRRQYIDPNTSPTYKDLPTGQTRAYDKRTDKRGRTYINVSKSVTLGGGSGWKRKDMLAASKRIINARLRSINFIRAGFVPAARAFARALGGDISPKSLAYNWQKRGGADDSQMNRFNTGVAKGGYRIAATGARAVAEISNRAVSLGKHSANKSTGVAALERYAGEGLRAALVTVTADLQGFVRKQLAARAARFNTR